VSTVDTPTVVAETRDLDDVTWIKPSKVTISNFHAGAEADYNITIHNGHLYDSIQKRVTTDAGESIVTIALATRIHENDLANVSITSDNTKDDLTTVRCDERSLTVSGFAPAASRIVTIAYKCDTRFYISFSYPGWADADYNAKIAAVKDWVVIADSSPTLAPSETRDIEVKVIMPDDAAIPMQDLEFWITVSQEQFGQVQTNMASRWLVSFREE